MPKITFDTVSFYSTESCPYCDKARKLLSEKGIKIEWEKKVGKDLSPSQFKALAKEYGWIPPTVPMIFYQDSSDGWTLLGGYNELKEVLLEDDSVKDGSVYFFDNI